MIVLALAKDTRSLGGELTEESFGTGKRNPPSRWTKAKNKKQTNVILGLVDIDRLICGVRSDRGEVLCCVLRPLSFIIVEMAEFESWILMTHHCVTKPFCKPGEGVAHWLQNFDSTIGGTLDDASDTQKQSNSLLLWAADRLQASKELSLVQVVLVHSI